MMISKRTSPQSGDLDRSRHPGSERIENKRESGRDTRAGSGRDEDVERGIATRYVVPNGVDRPDENV